MADVKINNGKYIFGDDGFEATTGDSSAPEESNALDHDTDNAINTIGKGAKVTEHLDPLIMADDGYFDLPAESTGHATLLIGDAEYLFEFDWDRYNTVNLISGSSSAYLVTGADNDTQFCAFDNTSSVRVKNRLGSAKRVFGEIHYTELPVVPTFQIFAEPSGVDNLEAELTINSIGVLPKFRYKLGDANATNLVPWGYGETLTRVNIGTPPTYNNGSPGLGVNDDSCKFNGSDYYKKTSATASQFTTGDIVVEIVFKYVDEVSYLFSTYATEGITAYIEGGNDYIRLVIYDVGGGVSISSAISGLVDDCWYHAIGFVNRDEASTSGSQWYINGVSSGTGVNMSAKSGTLTSDDFAVGARVNNALSTNSNIAYIAAWEQADWHQAGAAGPAEWSNIAKIRFAKFSGMYPQVFHNGSNVLDDGDMEAVGTSAWGALDATLAKDTTAPLYEATQHLRITSTAYSWYARQDNILTDCLKYRVTGAARVVSGSGIPVVRNNALDTWLGSGSVGSDWQEFDEIFISGDDSLFIGSTTADPGVVDFDNVIVTRLDGLPIVATRAYPAYLDKVEDGYRKLYYVGGEWLRMCHRIDSVGTNVRGYLPETEAENLFTYSEEFTQWTKGVGGDIVTDDAIVCPDGRTASASIICDATDTFHNIRLDATLTAATYAFSCFAKPGDKDWIRLQNQTGTVANVFFDVANGVVGTETSCTGYIEGPFFGGFYRCCMTFTGTAAVHSLRVYIHDEDLGSTTQGDGSTPNTYVWNAQCELGDYMTSPIRTSGSSLTRTADQLQFVAGDNIGGEDIGQGTVACDVLLPDFDMQDSARFVDISDGGSTSDHVYLYTSSASDKLYGSTRASAGDDGNTDGTTDMADGVMHEARMLWETDNLRILLDGSLEGTADTACDMPDALDEMDIGSNLDGGAQFKGLIQNLRIYDEVTLLG